MPRFEKWLTTATADSPADSVARAALAERLLAVCHFLDRALGGAEEAEGIHQLRVWTRRASAALKLFEPAVPDSQRKRMKKSLRKLRRTAGRIRDCDIHLHRLKREEAKIPKRVIRELKRERQEARQKLNKLRRHLQKNGRLQQLIERLLEKIGWPKRHSSREPPPFGSFCLEQLRPLGEDFFKLSGAELSNDKALHALRIAGKRLRYALELAPAALPPRAHRQLCDRLNEVQDRLGEICDQLTAIDRVRECSSESKKKSHQERLGKLAERERRQLEKLRAKLIRWWPSQCRQLREQWDNVV